MRRQGLAVWDGANVGGPDSEGRPNIHCPLMNTHGLNYWVESCKERQRYPDNSCPNSCERKKKKGAVAKQRRW